MTEKEKAKAGYLYNANYDSEIVNEIEKCTDLCYEYNQIKPSDEENKLLETWAKTQKLPLRSGAILDITCILEIFSTQIIIL